MLTQRLKVKGMTCASCVHAVKTSFQEHGFSNVHVSLPRHEVQFESEKKGLKELEEFSDWQDLKKDLQSKGYAIEAPLENQNVHTKKNWIDRITEERGFPFVSLLLALVFLLGMFFPIIHSLPAILIVLLGLFQILVLGFSIHRSAFFAISSGHFHMNVLMSLSSLSSIGLAILSIPKGNTFAHQLMHDLEPGVVIIGFLKLGKYLETLAMKGATRSLLDLDQILPEKVLLERQGTIERLPRTEIVVGDLVWVQPGEVIPVDGEILFGKSEVVESSFTGEFMPKNVGMLSKVRAGSLNLSGKIQVFAQAVGEDLFLGKVISEIQKSSNDVELKSPLMDRVLQYFIPTVMGLGFLSGLFHGVTEGGIEIALRSMMSVWVIACPCALGLANPIVLVRWVGLLGQKGILLKTSRAFRAGLNKPSIFTLDKTGTLTEGEAQVLDQDSIPKEVIKIAASLTRDSNHPLSKAITRMAPSDYFRVDEEVVEPGVGISGVIEGQRYQLTRSQREVPAGVMSASDLKREGEIVFTFHFRDAHRKEAKSWIDEQIQNGSRVILISGDRHESVSEFAAQFGISEYFSEQQPDQKKHMIQKLKNEGCVIAVGDGINDAGMLKEADLSLSFAAASDFAKAASDFILLKPEFHQISQVLDGLKKSKRLMSENLIWALGFNAIGIPAALFFQLSPSLGAILMAMSSIFVVLNAYRLR